MSRTARMLLFAGAIIVIAYLLIVRTMKSQPVAQRTPIQPPAPNIGRAVDSGVVNVIGTISDGVAKSLSGIFGNSTTATNTDPQQTFNGTQDPFQTSVTV